MSDGKRDETTKGTSATEAGGPIGDEAKTGKKSRLIAVAAGIGVLLGVGTLAFFKVPAFHALLHPHPVDNTAKAAQGAAKYTCGMHPFIISDKPGTCPICGMTLTRIDEGNPATGPAVEGYSTVRVGAESLRISGVQTARAVREKISRSVRAVGNVVPDETRVRRVQTKTEGWIEKLHVSFTGQAVTKGQPLLDIYSPELVASQREYLVALQMHERMKGNPYPEEKDMAEQLVQSSRRRLELFDVPQEFMEELVKTGKPARAVTLNAPVSGYVTAKEVFAGMRVMPGMELFTVTDLSRIWIEADLYEYEARSVRQGQEAVLAPAGDPGLRLKGRVAYVYPTLSPESRTIKARFEFPNQGMRLKPGMYADVSLNLAAETGVSIPDSALLETGVRQIVFVDQGGGNFEPREVKVGVRGDGKAQILSGVKEGEMVAVRANFLLDSESRLKAALAGMTAGGNRSPLSHGDNAGQGGAAAPAQPQGQPTPQDHAGHGGAR